MRPMASQLSDKDSDLIGEYAQFKGWRFGLVDTFLRTAWFYDKNEKCIRKSFSEMQKELSDRGDAKDGQHTGRR